MSRIIPIALVALVLASCATPGRAPERPVLGVLCSGRYGHRELRVESSAVVETRTGYDFTLDADNCVRGSALGLGQVCYLGTDPDGVEIWQGPTGQKHGVRGSPDGPIDCLTSRVLLDGNGPAVTELRHHPILACLMPHDSQYHYVECVE